MGDEMFDDTTETEPENTTVWVDNDSITVDDATTAAELKDFASADSETVLTFLNDEGQARHINDDEFVLDYVEPGTELEFQPAKDITFG